MNRMDVPIPTRKAMMSGFNLFMCVSPIVAIIFTFTLRFSIVLR